MSQWGESSEIQYCPTSTIAEMAKILFLISKKVLFEKLF